MLGCQFFGRQGAGPAKPAAGQPTKRGAGAHAAIGQDRPAAKDAPAELLPQLAAALADSGWVRAANVDLLDRAAWRWKHPALEAVCGPESHAALAAALSANNRVVAANAAIMQVRAGAAAPAIHVVVAAVKDRSGPLPLRCAAAEALGRAATGEVKPLLLENAVQAAAPSAAYAAELQAELILALARQIHPASDPEFFQYLYAAAPVRAAGAPQATRQAAVVSPHVEVRSAAVAAWSGRAVALPPPLLARASDDDPRVRLLVVRLVGICGEPRAVEILQPALADGDLNVKLAAIAALGQLRGEGHAAAAKSLLLPLAGNPLGGERIRSEAVRALGALGDEQAVRAAAEDRSWRVRQAAAQALGDLPPSRRTQLAPALIADPSPMVQTQAIAIVGGWPLDEAVPLLLQALEQRSAAARKAAAEQLSRRWPDAQIFAPLAPPAVRQETLARLKEDWERSARTRDAGGGPSDSHVPASPTADPALLARARRLLLKLQTGGTTGDLQAVAQQLRSLGPELVAVAQSVPLEQPLPEALFSDLLPKLGEEYAALDRLQRGTADERRQALQFLSERGRSMPLPPLAARRLLELVLPQRDPQVWRGALAAVVLSGSPAAIRLATAGASHPDADIRRRSCEHLACFPDPRQAQVLLACAADTDPQVVRAALAALERGGQLPDAAPLDRLLAADDGLLRLAAARTLARLGAPQGWLALERLSFDANPEIRRHVAMALGELADPAGTDILIRLLDDRPAVQRAALQSLPLATGVELSAAEGSRPHSLAAQWKAWRAGQNHP